MVSIEVKFNQALAAITKAGLTEKFNKQFSNIKESSIETKLNCALEVLKACGIIESINESGWALTFVPKARIAKKNGSSFSESSAEQLTETAVVTKKEALINGLVRNQNMQVQEARSFLNLKPVVPAGLTKFQECEYRSYRKSGLSEADALIACKVPLRVAR
jgi:hypothetical protein